MATRFKSNSELDAWDRYFAAALSTSVAPGALKNTSSSALAEALEHAAATADAMMVIRARREPKL